MSGLANVSRFLDGNIDQKTFYGDTFSLPTSLSVDSVRVIFDYSYSELHLTNDTLNFASPIGPDRIRTETSVNNLTLGESSSIVFGVTRDGLRTAEANLTPTNFVINHLFDNETHVAKFKNNLSVTINDSI